MTETVFSQDKWQRSTFCEKYMA